MARIRVAACQINTVVGDLAGNVARTLEALAEAEGAGADLAVFPELTVTGYPPEDLLGRPAFVADNLVAFPPWRPPPVRAPPWSATWTSGRRAASSTPRHCAGTARCSAAT